MVFPILPRLNMPQIPRSPRAVNTLRVSSPATSLNNFLGIGGGQTSVAGSTRLAGNPVFANNLGPDPATLMNTLLFTGRPPTTSNPLLPNLNLGNINPFSTPLTTNPVVGGLLNMVNNFMPGSNVQPRQAAPLTPRVPTGNIVPDSQLSRSLAKIRQDAEGASLLRSVIQKGYTVRVGDPSDGSDPPGIVTEGITNFNADRGGEIIINPFAKDFDAVLVHELYHALTDEDGDSKQEEAKANIIGDRVSARINRRAPKDAQFIIRKTFALYPDLPLSN